MKIYIVTLRCQDHDDLDKINCFQNVEIHNDECDSINMAVEITCRKILDQIAPNPLNVFGIIKSEQILDIDNYKFKQE